MLKKNPPAILWVCLLSLSFFLRLGTAFYWDGFVRDRAANDPSVSRQDAASSRTFFFGDSDSYWRLGRALAFHRPYQFDDERCWQIFRTPGYPAILAPLFWIFGEEPPVLAARLLGVLFGVLNTALVGLLALSLLDRKARETQWTAFFASLVFAIDPTALFQSVLVLSEESFLTFALLQNICLVSCARQLGLLPLWGRDERTALGAERYARRRRENYVEWTTPRALPIKRLCLSSVLLGLTTAATIYIRPSWYYYLPFALVVLFVFRFFTGNVREIDDYYRTPWETRFRWDRSLFVLVLAFATVFAALEPWIARNYRVAGRFVPTSLQLGASLYDGLNPNATGASDMSFVDGFRAAEKSDPSGSLDVHFEVRLDERMKNAAISWTLAHPSKALRLALVKLYRLWAPTPREKAFQRPALQAALALSFVPVFILGLCGAFRSLVVKGALWTLLIPALYVSSLHAIFVSSIRYRTPTLYGFFILSIYFIFALWNARASRRD